MSADAAAAASPAPALSVDEQMHLITRNLQEVMGEDVARKKLRAVLEKRPLKVYWGTATTGAPHIAYFVPMCKLADFLRAGCEVTILLADLHAYLDNLKAPWELLKERTEYYEAVIKQMLLAIGVPIEKLRFVRGRSYQLSERFTLDLYKMTTSTTEHQAKKAGAEVVKQSDSACLSGLLYPLLQALDEEYLGCDAQFGGVDQRKIFTLAEHALPQLGYAKRVHLMNPMVPGLSGAKMSSSEKGSKIDLLDSEADIRSKLRKAFCEEGVVEGNGVLAFVKMVLFVVADVPAAAAKEAKKGFTIRRHDGSEQQFASYAELEAAWVAKSVTPQDLKAAVAEALIELLRPIREHFAQPEMQALVQRAYPKEGAAASAAAAAGAAAAPAIDSSAPMTVARLDIKIGRVESVAPHPRADKDASLANLLVMQVLCDKSVGDKAAAPKQVVANIAQFVSAAELQGRLVAVLTNPLKPVNHKGAMSHALLLAAASEDNSKLELPTIPADASIGQRLRFEGFPTDDAVPDLAKANEATVAKLMADLRTSAEGALQWKGVDAQTDKGVVKASTLFGAQVKLA